MSENNAPDENVEHTKTQVGFQTIDPSHFLPYIIFVYLKL